jgi:hypothetical protein
MAQGLDTLCAGIVNRYRCAQVIERHQIPKYADDVARDSTRLRIRLLTGDSVVFVDSTIIEVETVVYSYREYLDAIQYHIVEVNYYEGGGYLLIDARTGKDTFIPELPVLSPDAARFVLTQVYFDYDEVSVQIWRLGANGPELEWRFDPRDVQTSPAGRWWEVVWGLSAPEWLSPTELQLRKEDYDGRLGEAVRVELTEEGWVLREPDA